MCTLLHGLTSSNMIVLFYLFTILQMYVDVIISLFLTHVNYPKTTSSLSLSLSHTHTHTHAHTHVNCPSSTHIFTIWINMTTLFYLITIIWMLIVMIITISYSCELSFMHSQFHNSNKWHLAPRGSIFFLLKNWPSTCTFPLLCSHKYKEVYRHYHIQFHRRHGPWLSRLVCWYVNPKVISGGQGLVELRWLNYIVHFDEMIWSLISAERNILHIIVHQCWFLLLVMI